MILYYYGGPNNIYFFNKQKKVNHISKKYIIYKSNFFPRDHRTIVSRQRVQIVGGSKVCPQSTVSCVCGYSNKSF